MATVPEIFSFLNDDFSGSTLQFLGAPSPTVGPFFGVCTRRTAECRKGVTNVKFHERPTATVSAIAAWERMNHPYVLPEDYKRFVSISDGMMLRWDFVFQGTPSACNKQHEQAHRTCNRQRATEQQHGMPRSLTTRLPGYEPMPSDV